MHSRLLPLALLATLMAVPAQAGKRSKPSNVAEVQLPELETAFVFGAGDRLSIKVYKHQDLDADLTVAPDGSVTMPLLGRLEVAGKGYSELVEAIETGLRTYYTDASVAVNVVEVNNRKVFVVGEVTNPAVLQITGTLTVLEALVRTGGININARTDNLLLIRGGIDQSTPQLFTIDAKRLLQGQLDQNVRLQSGDIVVVPTKTIANAERFFRRVQGILAPFVGASQTYRNIAQPGSGLFDDSTSGSQ